jgi:MFS family permease
MLGAIGIGILMDRVHHKFHDVILAICTVTIGTTSILKPFSSWLWAYIVLNMVEGIGSAGVEAGWCTFLTSVMQYGILQ